MNISEGFIKRPIATTLIVLGLMVFGAMSYRLLPVSDLPTIDFPTIRVQANLPGASPETMAAAVALPLEKQFATIPGLAIMVAVLAFNLVGDALRDLLDPRLKGE